MLRDFTASLVGLDGKASTGSIFVWQTMPTHHKGLVSDRAAFKFQAGAVAGKLPTGVVLYFSLESHLGAIWRTLIIPDGSDAFDLVGLPDRTERAFGDAPNIHTLIADYLVDAGSPIAASALPGYVLDGGFVLP